MKKTRFLVTGCAGFIGSHMVELLLAKGYETVGVDNLATGSRKNLIAVEGKFRFIHGDICDPETAAEAVHGVSHIIHLASIPSVPRSMGNPIENMHSSVTSTVTLLDAARKAGVQRVVQAASSAAYGDNDVSPKTEDLTPMPLSPYAAAKLAQEHYGMAFSMSYGLDTVALRYFNVFGPRQDPNSEYAAVIPKFITMILAGRAPVIFGDGGQSRDFIYVDNVTSGNLAAALNPAPLRGEVINLACGVQTDLNTLVAKINTLLGTSIHPEYGKARSGEVRHSLADISKAERLLGYRPAIDFDEGLRRTVAYFSTIS